MNTTLNGNRSTVRLFGHDVADTDAIRTTFWFLLLGTLGGLLAVLLYQAVEPSAIPERLSEALGAGGIMIAAAAVWFRSWSSG